MDINKDEKLYRSIVENKRVFKFLVDLNRDLDDVRGWVLSTKHYRASGLPSRWSNRKKAVARWCWALCSRVSQPLMVPPSLLYRMDRVQQPRKEDQFQDDCGAKNATNHNIDSCWKIHGKPWIGSLNVRLMLLSLLIIILPPSQCHSPAPNWTHFKGYSASKPGCHQTMMLDQEVRLSGLIIP